MRLTFKSTQDVRELQMKMARQKIVLDEKAKVPEADRIPSEVKTDSPKKKGRIILPAPPVAIPRAPAPKAPRPPPSLPATPQASTAPATKPPNPAIPDWKPTLGPGRSRKGKQ